MSSIYNLIGDPRPYIRTLALSHEDLNNLEDILLMILMLM